MEFGNAVDLSLVWTMIPQICTYFDNSRLRKVNPNDFRGGGQDGDVTDPYGSDQTVYNQCAEQILSLSRGWFLDQLPQKAVEMKLLKVAIGCDHGGSLLKSNPLRKFIKMHWDNTKLEDYLS